LARQEEVKALREQLDKEKIDADGKLQKEIKGRAGDKSAYEVCPSIPV